MRSLRVQLLLSHLLLVVLMGVLSSALLVTQFSNIRNFRETLGSSFAVSREIQDLRDAISRQQTAMTLFVAGQPNDARAEFVSGFPALRSAALTALNDYPDSPAAKTLATSVGKYELTALDVLKDHPPANREDATRVYFSRILPSLASVRFSVVQLQAELQQKLREDNEKLKDNTDRSLRNITIALASSLVFAVVLAYAVIRLVLLPLKTVTDHARLIGEGDLDKRLPISRRDEIGKLSESLNMMSDKLKEARSGEVNERMLAEQMSSSALESLYDPVVVTDSKGNIVLLNRAAEGLFGKSPDTPRAPIINHIGDKRIVEAIEHAIHNEVIDAEDDRHLVPITVGEAQRLYRLRATPIRGIESEVIGSVCVLEDITHLKEIEHLKDEFIGVASHELRTPVASLLLGTQLLLKGAVGELTPDQLDVIQTQKEDLERLHRMMQELLELSKLESSSQKPRFKLIKISELLKATQRTSMASAETKGVVLSTSIPENDEQIRVDPSQINRVLTNLTENAIRHTAAGGSVTIRAIVEANQVIFQIADTGEGIPPEYLDRIFERFMQVPGATQGGAGLGLAISQSILKAHGTEMKVESTLGQGSTFSFALSKNIESGRDNL